LSVIIPGVAFGQTITVDGVSTAAATSTVTGTVTPAALTYGPNACGNGIAITMTFEGGSAPLSGFTTAADKLILVPGNECPSVGANDTDVTTPSGGIVLIPKANITDVAATQTPTTPLTVAQLASGNCGAQTEIDWTLCGFAFWTTTTVGIGTSTTTNLNSVVSFQLSYNGVPPGVPTLASVDSGDQHLHIVISAPTDGSAVDHYIVSLLPTTDTAQSAPFPPQVPTTGTSGTTAASTSTSTSTSTGSTGASVSSDSGSTGSDSNSGSTGTSASTVGSTGSTGSTGTSTSTGTTNTTATTGTNGTTSTSGTACIAATITQTLAAGVTSAVVPVDNTLLTNGTVYQVQVQAVSAEGVTSLCSNVLEGTPEPISDFWRQYRLDGGHDTGCSQSGMGAVSFGLLLGGALLIKQRRRKGLPR
jgi:hypothetical protein